MPILLLLGSQGGSHSWMQEDCASAVLLVLGSSKDPAGLGFEKVTVFVSLKGKDPATGDPVPGIDLTCFD